MNKRRRVALKKRRKTRERLKAKERGGFRPAAHTASGHRLPAHLHLAGEPFAGGRGPPGRGTAGALGGAQGARPGRGAVTSGGARAGTPG